MQESLESNNFKDKMDGLIDGNKGKKKLQNAISLLFYPKHQYSFIVQ